MRVLRSHRLAQRGVTLFEMLIVVAIIALISTGVAIGAIKYWIEVQNRTAAANARNVRGAVKTWWVHNDPSTCPQLDDLLRDGTLDRDSPKRDPWGSEWRIECTETNVAEPNVTEPNVTVTSLGSDRKLGTADDIRIPPT